MKISEVRLDQTVSFLHRGKRVQGKVLLLDSGSSKRQAKLNHWCVQPDGWQYKVLVLHASKLRLVARGSWS